MPLFNWYTESLWQGCGIKPVAHDAVSSCFVSSSVPQNRGRVSMKVLGVGPAETQDPVINYTLSLIFSPFLFVAGRILYV